MTPFARKILRSSPPDAQGLNFEDIFREALIEQAVRERARAVSKGEYIQ